MGICRAGWEEQGLQELWEGCLYFGITFTLNNFRKPRQFVGSESGMPTAARAVLIHGSSCFFHVGLALLGKTVGVQDFSCLSWRPGCWYPAGDPWCLIEQVWTLCRSRLLPLPCGNDSEIRLSLLALGILGGARLSSFQSGGIETQIKAETACLGSPKNLSGRCEYHFSARCVNIQSVQSCLALCEFSAASSSHQGMTAKSHSQGGVGQG